MIISKNWFHHLPKFRRLLVIRKRKEKSKRVARIVQSRHLLKFEEINDTRRNFQHKTRYRAILQLVCKAQHEVGHKTVVTIHVNVLTCNPSVRFARFLRRDDCLNWPMQIIAVDVSSELWYIFTSFLLEIFPNLWLFHSNFIALKIYKILVFIVIYKPKHFLHVQFHLSIFNEEFSTPILTLVPHWCTNLKSFYIYRNSFLSWS